MATDPDSAEPFGPLQALLDDLVAAGRSVHRVVDQAVVRGDPPGAWVTPPLGRGAVEARWDLGSLVGWSTTGEGWVLSAHEPPAEVHLGHVVDDRPLPPQPDRRRLGWLADEDDDAGWGPFALDDAEELERLADPRWRDELGTVEDRRGRVTQRRWRTELPAADVLRRCQAALAALLPVASRGGGIDDLVAAMPAWLVEACGHPWWSEQARRERDLLEGCRGAEAARLRARAAWTPETVARHLLLGERAWRFHSARVVDEHTLDVAVVHARRRTLVVDRLLRAAGAGSPAGSVAPRG